MEDSASPKSEAVLTLDSVGDQRRPLGPTPRDAAVKRTIDIAVAGILLIVLVPVFLAIAVVIRFTSPGPVLFRQERIGRGGPFQMIKFRTMFERAHRLRPSLQPANGSSGLFKLRDDPRVTPAGRLLRRLSLDELPQLVNVLRGEMTLVGPRPLLAEEDALVDSLYRERLLLRPGMTGAWQAIGPVRPPLREMVVIDCLYVENWSLWEDVKILVRTAGHVVRLRGM